MKLSYKPVKSIVDSILQHTIPHMNFNRQQWLHSPTQYFFYLLANFTRQQGLHTSTHYFSYLFANSLGLQSSTHNFFYLFADFTRQQWLHTSTQYLSYNFANFTRQQELYFSTHTSYSTLLQPSRKSSGCILLHTILQQAFCKLGTRKRRL